MSKSINRGKVSRTGIIAIAALAGASMAGSARATSWTGATNQMWGNSINWGGSVPNGTDAVASFNMSNITVDTTVHLNGSYTAGNLAFGDTLPSNNWFLDNNGNAGNVLTLATTTPAVPTITVDNQTATISASLGGNQGLIKAGYGTLVLSGTSSYTGTTQISAGILNVNYGSAIGTNGAMNVSNGMALQVQGGITTGSSGSYPLTISGSVNGPVGGALGTLESVSGSNNVAAPLVINGILNFITADAGSTLNLSNPSVIAGPTGTSSVFLTGGGTGIFNGSLQTGGFSKQGIGTWTITNTNACAGGLGMGGGTLVMTQTSANPVMAIGTSSTQLTGSAGTLSIVNASTVPSVTQSFQNVLIGGLSTGAEFFVATSNATGSTGNQTVNLGLVTRLIGTGDTGAIDFAISPTATINTFSLNNSAGILGGWATVGGTQWAVSAATSTTVSGWSDSTGMITTAASEPAGARIFFPSTTGLPGGLTYVTAYYVVSPGGTSFQVANASGGIMTLTGTSVATGKITTQGAITPLTTYTGALPTVATTNTAGNYQLASPLTTSTISVLTGAVSVNSLNITDSTAGDNLNLSSYNLLVGNGLGGVLYSGGSNFTISGSSASTGLFPSTGATGTGELILSVSAGGTLTVACPIVNLATRNGTLTKSGTGTLVLDYPQTYESVTNVEAGTLQLGMANALPALLYSVLNVNIGATFDLNGYNQTITELTGAGTVTMGSQVLTIFNNNSTPNAFAGKLVGTSGSKLVIDGAHAVVDNFTDDATGFYGTVDIKADSGYEISSSTTLNNFNTITATIGNTSGITVEGAFNTSGTTYGGSLLLEPGASYLGQTLAWPNVPTTIEGAGEGTGVGSGIHGAMYFFGLVNQVWPGNITISNNSGGSAVIVSQTSGASTGILPGGSLGEVVTLTGNVSGFGNLYLDAEDNGPLALGGLYSQMVVNGTINVSGGVFVQDTTSVASSSTYKYMCQVILGGANTYAGNTRIGAPYGSFAAQPYVTLLLANPLALQNSTLDMNASDGGLIAFSPATTPYILGGLGGSRNVALADTSSNAITLSVGNNNQSTGYSGNLTGAGSLNKIGTGVLTLTGADNYAGFTNVSAGTVVIGVSGALPASNAVSISKGATLVLDSQATESSTASLNINGTMIVHGGSLLTLDAQALTSYNASWGNPTGLSSSAAAADLSHLSALGVIQNDNGTGSAVALNTMYEGQSVSDSDILVKYTYYGDTNLDGKLDGSDYSRIDYGFSHSLSGWFNGDFNYDSTVNGSDYTLMDNAFNQQGAQFSSAIAAPTAQISGSSAVPEPTTLGLLGMGAVGLLGRRSQSQKARKQ